MADGAYYGKMGFARFYALVFGLAYIGVSLVELIFGEIRLGDTVILQRTTLQNIVHWLVGIAVLGSFFAGEAAARMVARIVGIVFLVLVVWGFVAPESLGGILGYGENTAIPMSYNIIHLLTGLLALFAGFAGDRRAAATA